MNKRNTISLMAGTLLLLTGCGGGGGTSSAATATGTAYYVDSAVEGVTAVCGGTTTITDASGAFTFEEGRECQLKIGEVLLRTVKNLDDGEVIIEDAIRTAQFLQTLDWDGNPDNGIKIIKETGEVLSQKGIYQIPDNDSDLVEIASSMKDSQIGYNGRYTSESEAEMHLEKTHREHENQPDQPHQPDQPDQPNQPDQPHQPQQPDQPNQPDQPHQPDQPNQPHR